MILRPGVAAPGLFMYSLDMGQHSTPHGEESTYRANGGKQTFPYKGTHRKGEKPEGHKLGNPNRIKSGGTDYDRGTSNGN